MTDGQPDLIVHCFIAMFSGETGLGKSTLMDSLFNTNFESTPSTHNLPNVKLKAHTYELQESNVQLKVYIWSITIHKSILLI